MRRIHSILALLAASSLSAQPALLDEGAAREAVHRIVRHSGLQPNFMVRASDEVKTANAYVKDRQRVIAYNPTFMAAVLDSTRTDWSAFSVLAHEVAHHLLGHTIDPSSLRPGDELACDRYSGFVLFGMGASLEQCLAVQSAMGSPHGTRRHPPKHARLEAIRQGWEDARRLRGGLPPEVTSDADALRYMITFVNDENIYYADSAGQVVWFDAGACPINLGGLREEGKDGFALQWMEESFFVDGKLAIWRRSAHGMPLQVGRMQAYAR